ncbi:hypothetical protein CARUB_v10015374mg [Capsella rubella]|uniref:Pectinesterase n=2 Tax=Capsella rubella TaxID=81985 RepID=R0I6R3_9BRAS|nr:hypothetical protein CARUB_v10015374mg [Capsella rubella]
MSRTLANCDLKPDITVANDGSGDFVKITEAISSIAEKTTPVVIYVKAGIYYENVIVSRDQVTMYGDGKQRTIVSGNLNRLDHPDYTTYQTATFSVTGNEFIVKDMGFVNVAGPTKHQVVAFHTRSTHSVMFRCAFNGYQDTLYAHEGKQLYRECDIVGTVDFIFGEASAVFEMCRIMPRKPLSGQYITITAQNANDNKARTGFSIIKSRIFPFDENLTAAVYLGRPWGSHATVAIMESELGPCIDPRGWVAWNRSLDPPPPTVSLGEYRNYGPGSTVSKRVKWVGYTPAMTDEEAEACSIQALINQEGWLNNTCIPY